MKMLLTRRNMLHSKSLYETDGAEGYVVAIRADLSLSCVYQLLTFARGSHFVPTLCAGVLGSTVEALETLETLTVLFTRAPLFFTTSTGQVHFSQSSRTDPATYTPPTLVTC